MKFKTTTKNIKEYVLTVSKAVDPKPSTPALQGLYIKTLENRCELTGSDLDLVLSSIKKVEESGLFRKEVNIFNNKLEDTSIKFVGV